MVATKYLPYYEFKKGKIFSQYRKKSNSQLFLNVKKVCIQRQTTKTNKKVFRDRCQEIQRGESEYFLDPPIRGGIRHIFGKNLF